MRPTGSPLWVAMLAVAGLTAAPAFGAAWTAEAGDLVLSETTLADFYSYYARSSTNQKLLEEPGGSVVQAGDVRRYGFFLNLEYGLTDRVTANLQLAFFHTQHASVGDNVLRFTNSQPNTQSGLQDFTGNVKYKLLQLQEEVAPSFDAEGNPLPPTPDQQPGWMLAVSPYLGWVLPVSRYDTSLNNPLGDGVMALDLALAGSLLLPKAKVFVNADFVYRAREDKAARVGHIYPADVRRVDPTFPEEFTGAQIQDQIQLIGEVGYLFGGAACESMCLSVRAVVKRIETLGGESLTFEGMPFLMERGFPKQPMFDNSLSYDQDAFFVGGGPYLQVTESFGVGLTYVQAVWFRNFPNIKTGVLSLSWNPKLAKAAREKEERRLREELLRQEAAAGDQADAAATK